MQIHSHCPIDIKEHQKLRLAELITRLNNNLLLGCFILNFEEGEIIYKTVHLCIDKSLNLKTMDILFNTNAQTMDDFLPAISAVNSGYSEPCLAAQ